MKTNKKIKFNIKKGDQVVVIAGNDKNTTTPREVIAVYPDKARVKVDGVNIRTKHKKPNAQAPQGAIVKEEASIHISNVMLWDATAKAPSRVSRQRNADGKSVRIFKKSGKEI